jgi:hypothetical protein
MVTTSSAPAAGYKFNSFGTSWQEIKSHSSILFNERLGMLFFLLDDRAIRMNMTYDLQDIQWVRSTIYQIYKNIRTLIRNNPTMRVILNLETKDPGIYITDVIFGTIDKMLEYCQSNGYTFRRLYIIAQEVNRVEIIVKDVLQYYNYFIRPDFKQKPDIEIATEKYKDIADKHTVEELREIVGKRHFIDFETLGAKKIEITDKDDFNEIINDDNEQELLDEDLNNNEEDDINGKYDRIEK